tara:strand:- start:649 stop:1059 length:411 start_codon:yes stop_codon:yes gene_type:complete
MATRIIHNGPGRFRKKTAMETPPEGFATRAKVVRVVDGDTVDVIIKRRMRIRLEDCWAPETRTKDLEEKLKGLEAKDFAEDLLMDKEVIVFIPGDPEGEMKDVFTFGRAVGRVFLDGEDFSAIMVREGLATRTKNG